jgi:hypothetical protein
MPAFLAIGLLSRARPVNRWPPRWRNLLLTTHVVVAVGVLGTDLVLLTSAPLPWSAATRSWSAPATWPWGLLADAVLVPLALAAPLTGILLGWGPPGA